jgi:hypothetical protein
VTEIVGMVAAVELAKLAANSSRLMINNIPHFERRPAAAVAARHCPRVADKCETMIILLMAIGRRDMLGGLLTAGQESPESLLCLVTHPGSALLHDGYRNIINEKERLFL